ncbi:ATP-grasp domain-containing protein [Mycobacterium sp. 236(2023)]|uniref:ATP-grasp domain-containing protein n=1 Tax=Mycobacterium sp. 236(2023) TaxID=3038163 RepID=UPI0024157A9C|nr:ATP-grasp domain-containing protein [Mycobacterium sp. 236(2023)]MDG4668657.1 ATP-grasp domain-containing protein [Mycobacterium sp. 236(2023)]
MKGPRYEGYRASNPIDLIGAIHRTVELWGDNGVIVQSHIDGAERSIAFCAANGLLLDACVMYKTHVTDKGKTWGGAVREVPAPLLERVRRLARELGWSGGCELEFIHAHDGTDFLIDVNPRFPAWIHGATFANKNLPARLVSHYTGRKFDLISRRTRQFVRIVLEAPSKYSVEEVIDQAKMTVELASKFHPSDMPALSRHLNYGPAAQSRRAEIELEGSQVDRHLIAAIDGCGGMQTPLRIFIGAEIESRADALNSVVDRVSMSTGIPISLTYSVKTNPDHRVLTILSGRNFGAEVISQPELGAAIHGGFSESTVTLNGPAKFWPNLDIAYNKHLGAIFADTVAELVQIVAMLKEGSIGAKIVGIRVMPPGLNSRFGIDLSDRREFLAAVRALALLEREDIAIHFHHAASVIGAPKWTSEVSAALILGRALAAAAHKKITCVDLGGGWSRSVSAHVLETALVSALEPKQAREWSVQQVFLEPGKYLVESSMAIVSRVISIRTMSGERCAVVDASISELPDPSNRFRNVLRKRADNGRWEPLEFGRGCLLGRLCMEHDIPAIGLRIPADLHPGDFVAILNTGAYDASMSFDFGKGEVGTR